MKDIKPRSRNQEHLLDSIKNNTITIALGLNGTGKTFLALYSALKELLSKRSKINKIICVRPMVPERHNGETNLGALPGTAEEKTAPFNQGIIDSLEEIMSESEVRSLVESGLIKFEALSLLRGRSFSNAFIICDEAQLLKGGSFALKLLMTRLAQNSKIVILGDPYQFRDDFYKSDLWMTIEKTKRIRGIGICVLDDPTDVQRHPLVCDILEAFGDFSHPFSLDIGENHGS